MTCATAFSLERKETIPELVSLNVADAGNSSSALSINHCLIECHLQDDTLFPFNAVCIDVYRRRRCGISI
jgi:hypothetical protein